ncbi:hypothetical protein CEP52_010934 [Fusarium oligoseptatum]|uniref:Myb-like domain-containing protein n=1 Tax=Fusarium oligoseptatum TaxID=2604345 RepID=A0A428T5S5_9HYPO|nr:hypothetical protein CEP52_010934 [Fusarium oligoseptatum]
MSSSRPSHFYLLSCLPRCLLLPIVMNSKNWNDRADKDLFFTILSVKNIGVISGAEWTTIGNHMRGLGYGFTNEGCRQHFQGLRRAQNKAESNGGLNENSRKVDPTLNPITRRPGPGRGRPRKQPPVPVAGVPGEGVPNQAMGLVAPGQHPQPMQGYGVAPGQAILPQPMPTTAAGPGPVQVPAPVPAAATVPGPPTPVAAGPPAAPPTGQLISHATYPSPPRPPELPQNPPHLHPLQHGPQNQEARQEPPQDLREGTNTSSTSQPPTAEPNHQPPSESVGPSEHLEEASEDVDADADADVVDPIADVDADGDADADADAGGDEPAAKRQRLSSPDPSKEVNMDDEAVLVLAAHSGSADPFPSDFATYGEA